MSCSLLVRPLCLTLSGACRPSSSCPNNIPSRRQQDDFDKRCSSSAVISWSLWTSLVGAPAKRKNRPALEAFVSNGRSWPERVTPKITYYVRLPEEQRAEICGGHVYLLCAGFDAARPVVISILALKQVMEVDLVPAGFGAAGCMRSIQHVSQHSGEAQRASLGQHHALRQVRLRPLV